MKIKFYSTVLLFFTLFLTQAQSQGIHFEDKNDWKSILLKAKAENKYIFVDCYTTWCGPCRGMDADVFPLKEVGDFFNNKFINVKFQLDTTGNDPEQIKRQYKDAAYIQKEYKINAYPTYLFFSPNGDLVHIDGGGCPAQEFISKGANALNPQTQYYTQVKKYENGNRDASFLKNLTLLALHAYDIPAISKYANDYYATQTDLLSNENLEFVYKTTLSTDDTGFTLMLHNLKKFKTVIDTQTLHTTLIMIIIRSEFQKDNTVGENWSEEEWNDFENMLLKKYPAYAEEVLVQIKTSDFIGKNDWKNYSKTVDKFISIQIPPNNILNDFAWIVFQRCNDTTVLENALIWSKKSFADQANVEPGYIDTYANILYKLGRNKEALEWEMKAQNIAVKEGSDSSWGKDVIEKMQKGEKTW